MNQQIRNHIATAVELILKEFDIPSPITDIDNIVKLLNGRINSIDDVLVSSVVTKTDNQDVAFEITVSSCQSSDRRTFSIAKELGHLFLHMGYLTNSDLWQSFNQSNTSINYTEKEFQAHEFALNFLMPQKQYLDFVKQYSVDNHIDAFVIANHFGVPESKASLRGKLIGALTWN